MPLSFLRPFGQPMINPMMDKRLDKDTKADIESILALPREWRSERDLMNVLKLPLRRTRTALLVAQVNHKIEVRTRRVKNRANSHEEYRSVNDEAPVETDK